MIVMLLMTKRRLSKYVSMRLVSLSKRQAAIKIMIHQSANNTLRESDDGTARIIMKSRCALLD